MYLPKLSSIFFFIAVIITATLALHWYDGYRAAKEQGQDITYPEYIKEQAKAVKEGLGEIPNIVIEAQKGTDDITRGALAKIAEALFIYNLNTGEYPSAIEELLGDYIPENNKVIRNESFFYRRTGSGYEMGVTLPVSGEKYIIREK